jgi:hypothetical protein
MITITVCVSLFRTTAESQHLNIQIVSILLQFIKKIVKRIIRATKY